MPRTAAAKVKEKLKQTVTNDDRIDKYLSTGSTPLNLACSGLRSGGLPAGKIVLAVGDSSSGKSVMGMTILAEASINKNFDDYRLIMNATEDGILMDIEKFYGKKLAERIEMKSSETIEEFYDDLDDVAEDGRPCIYVQDSMDALSSEPEQDKLKSQKLARRKGADSAGSMGDGKAKINSARLRQVTAFLKNTGSILMIVTQTRDNIGFGSQFNPKTRSGGKALRFYARLEFWLAIKSVLKVSYKGKQVQVGILSEVRIKKNHITGKERTVEIPIYSDTGMDDIGSCIHFLIQCGHWSGNTPKGAGMATNVKAPEFKFEGKVEKLIRRIQDNDERLKLRKLTALAWKEFEEGCRVVRKSPYS